MPCLKKGWKCYTMVHREMLHYFKYTSPSNGLTYFSTVLSWYVAYCSVYSRYTAHSTVQQWINMTHMRRWITCWGLIAWPPQLLDLSQMDFFFCGDTWRVMFMQSLSGLSRILWKQLQSALTTVDYNMYEHIQKNSMWQEHCCCLDMHGGLWTHNYEVLTVWSFIACVIWQWHVSTGQYFLFFLSLSNNESYYRELAWILFRPSNKLFPIW
jgi:hypothetical protein